MELLLPLIPAALIGAGVFLVLSRALIRLIIGLSMIGYGANIAILLAGAGFEQASPPLLDVAGPYNDPLPQALILTAIVIGFGTTALVLVLSFRAFQETGTDDVLELVEPTEPYSPPGDFADPEHPSVSPEVGPRDRGLERGRE